MTLEHAVDVAFEDIVAASRRIDMHIEHPKPVRCSELCGVCGVEIVMQCENLQRTGSFKYRGASNAIEQLEESERERGVITYSSGNHAQAIARAAQIRKMPAAVVMPINAPEIKVAGVVASGAMIHRYDWATQSRESICASIAAQTGQTIIPPFNHPHVIAGQGTSALELIENAGAFDAILVPCGGGGLLSGTVIAAKALLPSCRVFGVEPALGDDAARSFASKTLCTVHNPQTIADGARTSSLGDLTFPIVLRHVDGFFTVSESQIAYAMRLLFEVAKLVVEPTGALALAAVIANKDRFKDQRVGVLLSGGNVDLAKLPEFFAIAGQAADC